MKKSFFTVLPAVLTLWNATTHPVMSFDLMRNPEGKEVFILGDLHTMPSTITGPIIQDMESVLDLGCTVPVFLEAEPEQFDHFMKHGTYTRNNQLADHFTRLLTYAKKNKQVSCIPCDLRDSAISANINTEIELFYDILKSSHDKQDLIAKMNQIFLMWDDNKDIKNRTLTVEKYFKGCDSELAKVAAWVEESTNPAVKKLLAQKLATMKESYEAMSSVFFKNIDKNDTGLLKNYTTFITSLGATIGDVDRYHQRAFASTALQGFDWVVMDAGLLSKVSEQKKSIVYVGYSHALILKKDLELVGYKTIASQSYAQRNAIDCYALDLKAVPQFTKDMFITWIAFLFGPKSN